MINKFCLQAGDSTREKTSISNGARRLGFQVIYNKICPSDCIPIGDVDFCLPLVKSKTIDFYPKFLSKYLYRKISSIQIIGSCELPRDLFVKDATKWKSDFESKIYKSGTSIKAGKYYWSDPVEFVQEWRYYIANGFITTGWYSGCDEDELAPELDIKWPSNFNGAVDFGRLSTGEIALVESHDPFACGWYGDKPEDYTYWQHKAWNGFIIDRK